MPAVPSFIEENGDPTLECPGRRRKGARSYREEERLVPSLRCDVIGPKDKVEASRAIFESEGFGQSYRRSETPTRFHCTELDVLPSTANADDDPHYIIAAEGDIVRNRPKERDARGGAMAHIPSIDDRNAVV